MENLLYQALCWLPYITVSHLISQILQGFTAILQGMKLRLKEVKSLIQGHTANCGERLSLWLLDLEAHVSDMFPFT